MEPKPKREGVPALQPSDGWRSASLSDIGLLRSHNEDACIELPEQQVWLVADGMGGHEAGDLASRTVVEQVASLQPVERLSDRIEALTARIQAANTALAAEGRKRGASVIGSTVAGLLLDGRHAVCVWAGDSRVYRLRDGRLRQLTRDHRWVNELVERGVITRNDAEHHPLANEITRAVGADEALTLSVEMRDLLPGDSYLICSDGLHGEVEEDEITDILVNQHLGDACRALVAAAKRNGARDNVTVIVVQDPR